MKRLQREKAVDSKRKIYSYNALKGIGAVGILFSHMSYLSDAVNPFWRIVYDHFMRFGSRCSSLFFVISGFLMAYTWKNAGFNSFIKGKLRRIYPLTLLVFVLAVACSFILNDTVNGDMAIGSPIWFISIVLNLTLLKAFIPIETVFYSFHGPSWYLSVLFMFYIVGYFIMRKIESSAESNRTLRLIGYEVVLIYVVQFVLCKAVDASFFSVNRLYLTYVNPYFRILGEGMLGILLCEHMPEIQKKIRRINKNVLEITALIIFFSFFVVNNLVSSSVWSAWIWFIPVTLLIVAFYDDAGIVSRKMKGSFCRFFGDISFELYMTYAFVYEGLPLIVGIINEGLQSWLLYHAGLRFGVTFVACLIFAGIVHIVMEKF